MDNLKVQTPGSRYCHFPLRDDYGHGYFSRLLSEHLVHKSDKKQPWVWEKVPGHQRNEMLDCRNYALAAFKVLPVDLDAIDKKLKKGRGEFAPAHTSVPQKTAKKAPPKKPKPQRRQVYDDW